MIKKLSIFLIILPLIFLTACSEPLSDESLSDWFSDNNDVRLDIEMPILNDLAGSPLYISEIVKDIFKTADFNPVTGAEFPEQYQFRFFHYSEDMIDWKFHNEPKIIGFIDNKNIYLKMDDSEEIVTYKNDDMTKKLSALMLHYDNMPLIEEFENENLTDFIPFLGYFPDGENDDVTALSDYLSTFNTRQHEILDRTLEREEIFKELASGEVLALILCENSEGIFMNYQFFEDYCLLNIDGRMYLFEFTL